jgi:DNA-binding protein HU-beta
LNKSELIDAVTLASDLPETSVGRAVNAALEAIAKALKKKDDVVLWSALVPTFSMRRLAARFSRNPRTGEVITIPTANVPTFRAGKALKSAVN